MKTPTIVVSGRVPEVVRKKLDSLAQGEGLSLSAFISRTLTLLTKKDKNAS